MSVHFEHKPEDPKFPMEFSLIHAGRNHNGVWMNWHMNLEILHVLNGSGYVLCDGEHIPVCKGDSVIVGSNCIHMLYTLNSNCDYAYLIPGISFCREVGIDLASVRFQTLVHDEVVTSLFSSLIRETQGKAPLYCSACHSLAALLLIHLYRNYRGSCSASSPGTKEKENPIHPILLYLQDHYREPVTLSQLAAQFGFNSYYLCHLFKKSTGLTLIQYINALRCNHAQVLLRSGEYTVSTVAGLCGFSDTSHFARQYKKFTGHSPSQTLREKP